MVDVLDGGWLLWLRVFVFQNLCDGGGVVRKGIGPLLSARSIGQIDFTIVFGNPRVVIVLGWEFRLEADKTDPVSIGIVVVVEEEQKIYQTATNSVETLDSPGIKRSI